MKLISKLVVTAFAASAALTAGAQAPPNAGYLLDGSGNLVMSGTGQCWRTGSWAPTLAMEPCDRVAKPVAAYVAPVEVALAPVVAAPALAAVAVVALPPQAVSFSGDALFAFDKSDLTPEGQAMLDGMVTQLQGASIDTISVTGHTDRIGSSDYNQQLSDRRAGAVKDYLIGKEVAANRIDAQGKGSSEPVTAQNDCRGLGGAKQTIDCLQPDRRVDIDMTGTRITLGSR